MTSLPSATCRRMSSSLSWRCRSRRSWSVIDSAPGRVGGRRRRGRWAGSVRESVAGDDAVTGCPRDGPLLARANQLRARSRRRARRPQAQPFERRRPPRPARRHVPHRLRRRLDNHAHRRRRTKDVDVAGTLHWSFDGGPLDADLQVDGPDRHDGALHLQSGCLIQGAALVRDHRHAQRKHVARRALERTSWAAASSEASPPRQRGSPRLQPAILRPIRAQPTTRPEPTVLAITALMAPGQRRSPSARRETAPPIPYPR